MKKSINLFYVQGLHEFLHVLTDEEIYDFDVNAESSWSLIMDDNKMNFQRYTPHAQQQVLDAIEYLFSTGLFEQYWNCIVPVDDLCFGLGYGDIRDKIGYLKRLFFVLTERELRPVDFSRTEVSLEYFIPKPEDYIKGVVRKPTGWAALESVIHESNSK